MEQEEFVRKILSNIKRMDELPPRHKYAKDPNFHSIRWPHEQILAKLYQFGNAYVRVQHKFKMFSSRRKTLQVW